MARTKTKLQQATAWSEQRAAERQIHIWSPVNKMEAWEGSEPVLCECGLTLDLKNPAMKDRTCVCGRRV